MQKPTIMIASCAVLHKKGGVIYKKKLQSASMELAAETEKMFPGTAKNNKTLRQEIYRGIARGELVVKQESPRITSEIRLGDWKRYEKDVLELLGRTNGTAIVAAPVVEKVVYSDQELTLLHENHELKAIIAQMEPYLRQIDVYEFIIKGRI